MKWKKIVIGFLSFCLLICLGIGSYFTMQGYEMYREAKAEMTVAEMAENIREKPGFTSIEELPEMYLDAVVSVEDHRFYKHGGIDPIAIARALWNDIKAGAMIEGGSTITQQLAKNQFFTQEKKLTRKLAEVFMVQDIERELSKEEILELYVNSIYFGDGYYCVRDASIGYFGKEPVEMDDYECTMLAGIPNAPSAYAYSKNRELAEKRQKKVVEQMVEREYLTTEEATEILENRE